MKSQGLYDSRYEHDSCGVGFVCNIKGEKSNKIVKQGLEALKKLEHRGAVGADPDTGDGAGILIQMPHEFMVDIAKKDCNIDLPKLGSYGTGLVFFPRIKEEYEHCKKIFKDTIKKENQILLGWRKVPVNNSVIGKTARESEPVIEQVFIAKGDNKIDEQAFEIKLYVIRKQLESLFYITNLSSKTFSYKGLLMTHQVEEFFLDLKNDKIKSSLALFHSRYSTNTFPTWNLAQPFRFLAHNGEINTLRGNINWMKSKENLLASDLFTNDDIKKILPIIAPNGSDSAALDNVLELLILAGRPLPHALMMLIPSAWENNNLLSSEVRDFYKYHASFMEPWDGPAAVAVTDGKRIGAVLDRNGLRPARYIITKDNLIIMASEVGVLDIAPENILKSARLEPGKIFYIDTEKGKIVNDEEVKKELSYQKPYSKWLKENLIELDDQPKPEIKSKPTKNFITSAKIFGYTREDINTIIKPMAMEGKEPTGSMGSDIPHAVLSKNPQLLYTYFKQLFAQVTNPPIDPIREKVVMSLQGFIGKQKNILTETPEHCHMLRVKNPILTNEDLEKIKHIKTKGLKTKEISILFKVDDKKNFNKALENISKQVEDAIKDGYSYIVLNDRGVDKEYAALPALLAVGAVHQDLVKKSIRSRIGIIVESAEPREVHHFAVLFGYGVDCINPYFVYEIIEDLLKSESFSESPKDAVYNYIKALDGGILKILSKMGISTLQSYKGAQIFEALGLHEEVIEKCFTGTVSRIGGADFDILAQETILRHKKAFDIIENTDILPHGGLYQWRKGSEFHLWNPDSIFALQDSVRRESYDRYKEFAELINNQSNQPTTLRGLFDFKKTHSISIDEVEPAEKIYKRIATGAMSFGSISRGAHETLAIAMNRLGGRSNTGEGGEDPARFVPMPNGDSKRSAIKQVASGRFGVTTNYLVNSDEIQIKIAQGAKPGEGGQLPGHKVSVTIAKTRYTTPGVTLISPPPHHDIYSIEDLAQLIFDLKNTNPSARISVKLVSEIGVGTVAAGVAKGHADMILISGADGGTGASPISSIRHAGLPWELGLSETHQTLVLNDLRSRVRLQTDGQMRTGRDIAIAAILGAEEFGFCTSCLIVSGCVMLRHCHLNNCSVGVATQDDMLQAKFRGKPEYIENYFRFVVQELREIMASLGVRTIQDMIGKTELLYVNEQIMPWKAKKIDLSKILYKPNIAKTVGTYCSREQEHRINNVLDRELIKLAKPALEKSKNVKKELIIKNTDRTTGAMLSGEVCKQYGEMGLVEDTIHFKFNGVAGQSFGAFLAKGLTFELEGLANDYVGKGISGGKIIIYPNKNSDYNSDENIIIGNTTFYGAISGEAYIRGVAGERFCIRNSGLYTVVEGLGDHGCEYMTGGRAVIIGNTGINFGAGMSGGIAYVFDENKDFSKKCNMEMISLENLENSDLDVIQSMLCNHFKYTKSPKAKMILDNINETAKMFIKVMPLEFKRILEQKKLEEKLNISESV